MTSSHPTKWGMFRALCRVLGDQDYRTLNTCAAEGFLTQLIEMAHFHDVLPALAVRCEEQLANTNYLDNDLGEQLKKALRDNTLHNMQIKAQSIKLTRQLNRAGIYPLFLKGAVALLETENKKIGFRKQVDIDLLVKPEQLEAAGNALLADNYCYSQLESDNNLMADESLSTKAAIKLSASHHHLPPLIKQGYCTSVELHRHFLPKRFQRKNLLDPLFNTALLRENQGASFLIPSAEYQIIHLILGKLVYDGHLARRTMPLREACDYIHLLDNVEGMIDNNLIEQYCGKNLHIFDTLVTEFMSYTQKQSRDNLLRPNIEKRIRTMQKCYSSERLSALLNTYARALHLSHALVNSPAKLPTFLNRLITTGQASGQ